MALTDRLMIELRTRLPGAIDSQIKDAIWSTLNDMCRDAWLWRETINVTLEEGEQQYAVTPAGTEIVHVFSMTHATLDTSGSLYEFGTLLLNNVPGSGDVSTPVFLNVVLAPALASGADVEGLIPGDMWGEHHQMILDGTMGRMMAQPAKPFSNPQLAAFHVRAYNGLKALARRKAHAGPIPGAQTWRFPRWAQGRRLR